MKQNLIVKGFTFVENKTRQEASQIHLVVSTGFGTDRNLLVISELIDQAKLEDILKNKYGYGVVTFDKRVSTDIKNWLKNYQDRAEEAKKQADADAEGNEDEIVTDVPAKVAKAK